MKPILALHDVLQYQDFSPWQQVYRKERSMWEWFQKTVGELPGVTLKMVIVADGINVNDNQEWVEMIKERGWEVQCHGWGHREMKYWSEAYCYEQLSLAKEILEVTFNQKITQMYPPRHAWSHNLFNACVSLGMTMMMEKSRPEHVLGTGLIIPEIYIHYWNPKNIEQVKKVYDIS